MFIKYLLQLIMQSFNDDIQPLPNVAGLKYDYSKICSEKRILHTDDDFLSFVACFYFNRISREKILNINVDDIEDEGLKHLIILMQEALKNPEQKFSKMCAQKNISNKDMDRLQNFIIDKNINGGLSYNLYFHLQLLLFQIIDLDPSHDYCIGENFKNMLNKVPEKVKQDLLSAINMNIDIYKNTQPYAGEMSLYDSTTCKIYDSENRLEEFFLEKYYPPDSELGNFLKTRDKICKKNQNNANKYFHFKSINSPIPFILIYTKDFAIIMNYYHTYFIQKKNGLWQKAPLENKKTWMQEIKQANLFENFAIATIENNQQALEKLKSFASSYNYNIINKRLSEMYTLHDTQGEEKFKKWQDDLEKELNFNIVGKNNQTNNNVNSRKPQQPQPPQVVLVEKQKLTMPIKKVPISSPNTGNLQNNQGNPQLTNNSPPKITKTTNVINPQLNSGNPQQPPVNQISNQNPFPNLQKQNIDLLKEIPLLGKETTIMRGSSEKNVNNDTAINCQSKCKMASLYFSQLARKKLQNIDEEKINNVTLKMIVKIIKTSLCCHNLKFKDFKNTIAKTEEHALKDILDGMKKNNYQPEDNFCMFHIAEILLLCFSTRNGDPIDSKKTLDFIKNIENKDLSTNDSSTFNNLIEAIEIGVSSFLSTVFLVPSNNYITDNDLEKEIETINKRMLETNDLYVAGLKETQKEDKVYFNHFLMYNPKGMTPSFISYNKNFAIISYSGHSYFIQQANNEYYVVPLLANEGIVKIDNNSRTNKQNNILVKDAIKIVDVYMKNHPNKVFYKKNETTGIFEEKILGKNGEIYDVTRKTGNIIEYETKPQVNKEILQKQQITKSQSHTKQQFNAVLNKNSSISNPILQPSVQNLSQNPIKTTNTIPEALILNSNTEKFQDDQVNPQIIINNNLKNKQNKEIIQNETNTLVLQKPNISYEKEEQTADNSCCSCAWLTDAIDYVKDKLGIN